MCGICAILYLRYDRDIQECQDPNTTRVSNRGPDSKSQQCVQVTNSVIGRLIGFTLHFQGDLTRQPIEDSEKNLLLWNGEIFDGLEVGCKNDGFTLSKCLNSCEHQGQILNALGALRGPWAFIYLQHAKKKLWFGRDVFGRRSLLMHTSQNVIAFASVACADLDTWQEVPANGIYCIEFQEQMLSTNSVKSFTYFPWILKCDNIKHATAQDLNYSHETSATLQGKIKDLSHIQLISDGSRMFNTIPKPNEEQLWGDLQSYLVTANIGITVPITNFCDSLPNIDTCFDVTKSETRNTEVDTEKDLFPKCEEDIKDPSTLNTYDPDLLHHTINKTEDDSVNSIHISASGEANNDGSKHGKLSNCKRSKTNSSVREKDINEDISSDMLLNYMTPEHDVMSDKLIDILGAAVEVRVNRQSHLCHNCITQSLAEFHCIHNTPPSNHEKTENNANQISEALSDINLDQSCETSTMAKILKNDFSSHGDKNQPQQIGSNINTQNYETTDFRSLDIGSKRCGHARVGVLFSGGIDSLVIAALADRFVPKEEPIDLLNVAFEQVRTVQMKAKKPKPGTPSETRDYEVPDRITGRDGLKQLNPKRKWNFIEINVTLEELQQAREDHVKQLVYPLQTVLDDSIGCAVWFAARGRGVLASESGHHIPYTTTARVMLVGMGADEQLAGYSRHRVKFKTSGWQGVVDEIKMEIERISARNLGRDDRIISDHAREARFPFLDEKLVSFLNSLPIWLKANLSLPRGIGEKLLLRIAAYKLGLIQSSTLPKRAIQFGSRIAKIENRKEKGSDVCQRL